MKHLIFKTHRNSRIQTLLIERFIKNYPGIDIEFTAEPEHLSPSDMFDDERDIKYIQKQWERGNDYVWFCAKVTVSYKGYSADDYLGCCSYESERDFKENSGYYADMIYQCVQEINNAITDTNADICRRFNIRQLKNKADELGFIVIPKTAIV